MIVIINEAVAAIPKVAFGSEKKTANAVVLALPRFRGHLIIWEEGVHILAADEAGTAISIDGGYSIQT